jgi:hypothetical protein
MPVMLAIKRVVLSSFLKRKRDSLNRKTKFPTTQRLQNWDRDIVCLPAEKEAAGTISYSRGKFRSKLGERGLIRLTSSMSEEDVDNEIRSVFAKQMNNKDDFPFTYLSTHWYRLTYSNITICVKFF